MAALNNLNIIVQNSRDTIQVCSAPYCGRNFYLDFFLDLTDCQIFHVCKNGRHIENKCSNGELWDTVQNLCVNSTLCYTLKECDDADTQIPYVPNPHFYVDCFGNRPYIDRCLEGEIFDVYESCYYRCTISGSFPHENVSKYYECSAPNAVGIVRKCPEFFEYNPELGFCDISRLRLN